MKKTLCVFLALFLALSLLSVPALAAEGDSSFEPVTVADDESVKIVVTDLVSSPEDSFASFTLEITNKTDIALDISYDTFAVNGWMCSPHLIDGTNTIPAGETAYAPIGWESQYLSRIGVNYVESAEGLITTAPNTEEFYAAVDAAREGLDRGSQEYDAAYDAVSEKYSAVRESFPVSLTFPVSDMDVPATEEIVYDTTFEPVVIADNEIATTIVHDYYCGEFGPTLVISIENKTSQAINTDFVSWYVDGIKGYGMHYTGGWGSLPAGTSEVVEFYLSGYYDEQTDESGNFTSANNIFLNFTLTGEDGSTLLETPVELDVSAYADAVASTYGTASLVEQKNVAKDISLYWVPDPETDADAMVTLGDNGEYRIGMTFDKSFPGIIVYFENINGAPVSNMGSGGVTINGEPIECIFGSIGEPFMVRPGDACNYAIGDAQPTFPSDGFDMQIKLRFDTILETTVTVSFAVDGSATIEQVS